MTHEDEHDVELERLAGRLGVRAAERLDVERTAAAVVERLRADRRARRIRWIQPSWLRAAALVALMVGVGIAVRGRRVQHQTAAAHYVREELQDLTADQLREVLGGLDQTLNDATVESTDDDFGNLTTEQLRALLQSLEG
jgi:hypothetical protein